MFCDLLNDTFLTQMNYFPTRITDNTENILDLVITNQPERVCGMEKFYCQFASDHLDLLSLLRPKSRESVLFAMRTTLRKLILMH